MAKTPLTGPVFYDHTQAGCWMVVSHAAKSDGYVPIHRKGKTRYLHRVVWEIYHGQIPKGQLVSQVCGNRRCTNPDHLTLITSRERGKEGRRGKARGQEVFLPLPLNKDRVEVIRRLLYFGVAKQIILQIFGLTRTALEQIKREISGLSEDRGDVNPGYPVG